ncbi:MAG: hypothetical protein M3Z04_22325 [Chloroflexota bacterium]|nr:hypothetical protein [Chloroflexota bacterium]
MAQPQRKHGVTSDQMILLYYKAYMNGNVLSGTELANNLGVSPSTISKHQKKVGPLDPIKAHISINRVPLLQRNTNGTSWELTEFGIAEGKRLSDKEKQQVRIQRKRIIHTTKGSGERPQILSSDVAIPVLRVPFYGPIAAGPAIPMQPDQGAVISISNLAPGSYFAMEVRGDSMLDFHVCSGDLVIIKPVSDWMSVRSGDKVAVRVPEGTELVASAADLIPWTTNVDEVSMPALDHITLKTVTIDYLKKLRQGLNSDSRNLTMILQGSGGNVVRPIACEIMGVVAKIERNVDLKLAVHYFE